MVLDNIKKIKEIDKSNLLSSIELLPDQIKQGWIDLENFFLPELYKKISKVIVCGMGGSALGPHFVKFVFGNELCVPLEIISDYNLPKYADENSLIILSSYSGNTEEVIYLAKQALNVKAKCVGISTGGKLEELCFKNKIPFFKIYPKFNPCGQPRMGLGYSIVGMIGILEKCGLIQFKKENIEILYQILKENNNHFSVKVPFRKNLAKKFAKKILGKITILIAAEFLSGSIHIWQNQQHEISKNFGCYFLLPELNHHLIEGLSFPQQIKKDLIALFVKSKYYSSKIKDRIVITAEIFRKNKIDVIEYQCLTNKKLFQAFELIHFGSYVNFYLAILNNVDPTPIPWVDFLKKELEK